MADNKTRHALITKFEQLCREHGLPKPVINRVTEKWTADDILTSFSMEDINASMSYYFRISKSPTWGEYARKVDRLLQAAKAQQGDIEMRAAMREKNREWLI